MAAYNSIEKDPTRPYPVSGVGLGGRTSHHARGQYTVTTNLAAGDTIAMFRLPPRARIKSGFIKSDAVDSASAVTYNLGIAGTPALFFAASTVGRTGGGVDRVVTFAGTDYVTAGFTEVFLTVLAAPGTPVTGGTIVTLLEFIVEEPA